MSDFFIRTQQCMTEQEEWMREMTPDIQTIMRTVPPGCIVDGAFQEGAAAQVVSYADDGRIGVVVLADYPRRILVHPHGVTVVAFHKTEGGTVLNREWVEAVLGKVAP